VKSRILRGKGGKREENKGRAQNNKTKSPINKKKYEPKSSDSSAVGSMQW